MEIIKQKRNKCKICKKSAILNKVCIVIEPEFL